MRSILVLALTLAATSGVALAAAGTSHAATPAGSILYVKNHDIYAVTPGGHTTRRITHNGGQATSNRTGGIGYHGPSASANGKVIVAFRNQRYSPVNQQGWLYVLNRNGATVRRFKPPQFDVVKLDTSPCASQQQPRGLIDAMVSPDGKYIIYTAIANDGFSDCSAALAYSTWIVNINGTGGAIVKRGTGNSASLEAGQWVSNSRVLLDDIDFGSQGFWYVDLPSHRAKAWTQASDLTDGAWAVPALHKGKLASVGYSNVTNTKALRLWSSSGPPARPVARCDLASPVGGDYVDRPSWSPASDAVAFVVSHTGGGKVRSREGVYVMSATDLATSCRSPRLLVPGGTDSFWSATNLA